LWLVQRWLVSARNQTTKFGNFWDRGARVLENSTILNKGAKINLVEKLDGASMQRGVSRVFDFIPTHAMTKN
jgi:hypothetical protein